MSRMANAAKGYDSNLRCAKAFAKHAWAWEHYTLTPLGRLRQDLVTTHLLHHLHSRAAPVNVLDAGSGTGGYALALARQGHHVCLLDFAEDMLEIAQQRVAEAGAGLLGRVDFSCIPIEKLSERFPAQGFQVVLVHTLLEYLDEPWAVLRSLIDVLTPEGLISLLVVNPYAEAFRLAWAKRDLASARQTLTVSVSPADLFGLPRHVLPPERIRQTLCDAQVEIVAEYGIRIFSDYFTSDELADAKFLDEVKELELAAGQLEPYKRVARYLHIVGVKPSSLSQRPD
jgi:S-adenosylmethionine-dependent methyltransferase